jgi:hypothetical protein
MLEAADKLRDAGVTIVPVKLLLVKDAMRVVGELLAVNGSEVSSTFVVSRAAD